MSLVFARNISPILLFFFAFTAFSMELQSLEGVPICENHGGVNCDITRDDGAVVCNDGTVNNSFIIYAVPECWAEQEKELEDESAFFGESGCFPPSEIGCTSEESLQNLQKILQERNQAESELGKAYLSACIAEVKEFENLNANYKQCLLENGRPDFIFSGRETLPILKFVFCSVFYGEHSSYNFETDLCLCDDGYFLQGETCAKASLICELKHGNNSYVDNGNCFCMDGFEFGDEGICLPKKNTINLFNIFSTKVFESEKLPEEVKKTSLPTEQEQDTSIDPIRVKKGVETKDNSNFITAIFKKVFRAIINFWN